MAISHKDHDHPNTPAARAACRKAMAGVMKDIGRNLDLAGEHGLADKARTEAAQMTVVPRKRGDGGVVKGLQATAPHADNRRLKVSGSLIKSIGDLADVPAVLAGVVRQAWMRKWTVQAGHPFNDAERRIVITGPVAEMALVWDADGRTGYFVRNHNSSLTHRVSTSDEAFRLAGSSDGWGDHGNLA